MRASLVMGVAAAVVLAGCAVDPYAYGADYSGQSRYNNNQTYGRGVDASATATYGEIYLDAGFNPDPYTVSVIAGGDVDASDISSGCAGMVARAPDLQVTYGSGSLPLTFGVHGRNDTTLVINDPSGRWVCDDDSGGDSDPLVTFRSPQSGTYDVWVGAYGGNSGQADLYVTELGADGRGSGYNGNRGNDNRNSGNYNNRGNNGGDRNNFYGNNGGGGNRGNYNNSSNGGAPDSSLNATYGDTYLSAGFDGDPYTVSVAAGGAYDASNLGGSCVGMIAAAPDFQLTYEAGSLPLILSVDSSSDTTLVVNGPDGRWYCDDDSGSSGSNPMVRFNRAQSGTYDIWIGSYGGRGGSAELNISEVYSQ